MEEKDLPESEETALSHPDYAEEIVALVRGNTSPGLLREKLLSYHENDIAEALSKLNRDERARIFNILDGETLSDIFPTWTTSARISASCPFGKKPIFWPIRTPMWR